MAADQPEHGAPLARTGLSDFWEIFSAHYDEAIAFAFGAVTSRDSTSVVLDLFGPGGSRSESVRKAIHLAVCGDWSSYSAHLRAVAGSPAAQGVPLTNWSDVIAGVESRLLGPTVAAYRLDCDRLTAALGAKRRFFYQTLRLIAETLLRNREGIIERQSAVATEAARELVRSEARKNFIVDAALDAIVTIDHRSRVLEFNPAAERLFGHSRKDVLGRDLAEILMPARFRAAHHEGVEHMLSTGHGRILGQRIEMPAVRADGSELLVELSVTQLPSTDPPAFTGFMRDVTAQRKAQEALRSSEARHRQLFEHSPLPTWVVDHRSQRFLEVNNAAVEHYGYSREEFLSLTVAEIQPEESPDELRERFAGAGKIPVGRMTHRKKDGERITVEVVGYPIQHEKGVARLVVATDVTARERAEEQLRRSEARFATLYNAGILGIAVLDMGGAVLEANDAWLRIIDYRREDLAAGRLSWHALTPPEWRQDDDQAVRALVEHGSAPTREKEYLRRDGTRVPVLLGSAALEKTQFLSFVLDLSERKRLEQVGRDAVHLKEENRRILEASRLKSEFLASMSHELRTPLNAIIGFADLMHDEEVAPEEARDYLGDILSSARHLLGLIDDVLDLAKVEAGRLEFWPEQVACGALVDEVVNVLRPMAAAKGMTVQTTVDPALDGSVFLDPTRLKQVLYNYLSNALKFTHRGGKVAVRLRAQGEASLRIEVEDDGPGIASGDLDRLFVEFQQLESGASRSHEGTGLGLALTRRLVEAQGGTVGVLSQAGRGSVFHAVLPRRGEVPPAKGSGR